MWIKSSLKKLGGKIDFNSPVILCFAILAFIETSINAFSGGRFSGFLMIQFTSWIDPMMYIRFFTGAVAHADFSHFTSNFLMILVIGPLLEEKYGSRSMLIMMAVTAIVTGLISVVFFKNIGLMGASGIVFMLIVLSSFTNIKEGKFPLTTLIVLLIYLGNEILNGLFEKDSISQMGHIIGGLCGSAFGFVLNFKARNRKNKKQE